MKILATKEFNEKFNSYTDTTVKSKLLSLIEEIEFSGNFENLLNQSQSSVNNVFIFKIQDYRIFYTIEDDTVLLVDLIKKASQKIRINSKNPTYNRTINPTYNRTINPTYNRTINPTYNRTINPTYNRTINPTYNRTINPTYNRAINPTYNRTINPTYNRTINPKFNTTINPKMNPSFNGKYVFDLNGQNIYFIVEANENILLIYDFDNEIRIYGVKYDNGYALFDFHSNKYVSYLSSDNQEGFNQFDLNGKWIGYIK